jgi:Family of unknown function (DUF5696)
MLRLLLIVTLLPFIMQIGCIRSAAGPGGTIESGYLKLAWEGQQITVTPLGGGQAWSFDLAHCLHVATDQPGCFVQKWTIDFGMDENPDWDSPAPALKSIECPTGLALCYRYETGGTEFSVSFKLLKDAPEVEVEVAADTTGIRIVADIEVPGHCRPEGGEITGFYIPYLQGITWKRDLQASFVQHFRVNKRVVGLTMPFFLVNSENDWMMCVFNTPDDAAVSIYKEEGNEPELSPRFYKSLNSLRYKRRLTYRFAQGGSYTEMCKTYRDRFAKPAGDYKTFAEKTAERPILEKALGAPYVFLGYYNQTPDTVMMALDTLKAMGYDRALVLPFRFYNPGGKGTEHLSPGIPIDFPDLADKVRSLGYIPCGWLLVNHITKDSPSYDRSLVALNVENEPLLAWRIGKNLEWQAMLPDKIIPTLQLEEQDWVFLDGFHFDTGASTGLFESFSIDGRVYTRTDDKQSRIAYFKYFTDKGKVNISEGAQTWTVPYLDVGSVQGMGSWIEEGLEYELVPLWHLVFHECLQGAWHEGQTYQAGDYRKKFLYDIAWGSPPTIAPIMCLYRYNSREAGGRPEPYGHNFLRPDGKLYKQQIRESVEVYKLAREVAGSEMTSHAFLDMERKIVRSEFSTGHVVYVNFNSSTYTLPDGREIEGENYLVDRK